MCFPGFRPSLARLTTHWRRPTPRSEVLLKSRDCTSCCLRARAFCRKDCESPNTRRGCEGSSCSGGSCCCWEWQHTSAGTCRICFGNRFACAIQRRQIEDRPDLLALHVERTFAQLSQAQSGIPSVPEANPGRPTVSTPATLTPIGYLQFENGALFAEESTEFSRRIGIGQVT